jgi:hypothetical protein
MQQKIIKTILSGIVATIVMTLFTMLAPMMGMPEMNPPKLLSGMLGVPYPRAKFKGKIVDFEMKAGKQQVVAEGELEIHGVTKGVSIPGDIEVSDQTIQITAQFPVRVADHNIKIPKVVASNIAEVVDVTLDFNYVPHEEIQ